mmetsp:Transcript_18072/g.31176  ORF Transcript_18072/g.31176 Transcript_18072/m.31176 type:complete len:239 (-) Transcript_18072:986-1702(-)
MDLVERLAASHHVRLGEEVGHELVVVRHDLAFQVYRVLAATKPNEVRGDDSPLVEELIKAVLAICPWLSKLNNASLVVASVAVDGDTFAVGLHRELLDVTSELDEGLGIGKDGTSLLAEEAGIPDSDETHKDGQVVLQGRREEVVINVPSAGKKLLGGAEAVLDREGEGAHTGRHAVTSADPVPHGEDVVGPNAELFAERGVGADGHEMRRDVSYASGGVPLLHDFGVQNCFSGREGL